jgi:alpha-tubulin suppressor-like RCC1 family protein
MLKKHFLFLNFLAIFISVSCDTNEDKAEYSKWKMVSANSRHTCAIDENNRLFCWGINIRGPFLDGSFTENLLPELIDDNKWQKVAVGETHNCGIRTDGDLYCWGENYYGQLGVGGDKAPINTPTKVGKIKWKTVKIGYNFNTCALSVENELYCWGLTNPVTFGDIPEKSSNIPKKAGDFKWKDIVIGRSGGCGISLDDDLYCWGRGQYPVVDYESETRDLPNKIGDDKWIAISINIPFPGANRTCAIRSDLTLFCWGYYIHLGPGSMKKMDSGWKEVSVGDSDICGIKKDDRLYCLGNNMEGLFFYGGQDYSETPKMIGSKKWKSIVSGTWYKCGITEKDELYCWGSNSFGQIGNGQMGNEKTPAQVDGDEWEIISSAPVNVCGIKKGKLYCWGSNFYGQVGDGTMTSKQQPQKITDKNWKAVSNEWRTTFAIDEEKQLYYWGHSYENSVSDDLPPEQIFIKEPVKFDDGEWLQISAGTYHTCGIKADNKIYCWGENNDGQLGFGRDEEGGMAGADKPKKVNDEKWRSVYSGHDFTCALNMDGFLFCWGQLLTKCDDGGGNILISSEKTGQSVKPNYTI